MSVRSKFTTEVIDDTGNALDDIEVTVLDAGTSDESVLYSGRSGSGTISNPITTNATGLVEFWAAPGSYDIGFHDTQLPTRISDSDITWEAVSGQDAGIDWTQIDSAGKVDSTALAPGAVTTSKIDSNAFTLGLLPIIPAVKVWKSTAQSITGSTETTLQWDVEDYDTDTMHDNSTNNSRLYAKTAGLYIITANVNYDIGSLPSMQQAYSFIRKNGSNVLDKFYIRGVNWGTGGGVYSHTLAVMEPMAVNDYVEVRTYSNGSSPSVQGVLGSEPSHFEMAYVGRIV